MLAEKYGRLREAIKKQGSVVVAYSGGVDSSVLAKVAYDVLGDKAVAVTLDSETLPRRELSSAKELAKKIGIRHVVLSHSELKCKDFAANPADRCFYCKRELSSALASFARKHGFASVLEGTNASELLGHRPGVRALREAGVASPLADASFTKEEVRGLAGTLGLPNAEKPSSACLSSRIPYGEKITKRKLREVELAEDYLKGLGVSQVRVRAHKGVARIEVEPKDFPVILENRVKVAKALKEFGFTHVTLDVLGYRTGSMNE